MNLLLKSIHNFDVMAFLWLNAEQRCRYRRLVRSLSRSADGPVYLLLGLLLLAVDGARGEQFFFTTLVTYLLEVALYWVFKNTIQRDRPSAAIDDFTACIVPSDKFSFPSGHTAAAFVFACMVATFYPAYGVVAFIWAALVGMSRVLLGVHYPTDILAGAVLGSSCAYLVLHYLT